MKLVAILKEIKIIKNSKIYFLGDILHIPDLGLDIKTEDQSEYGYHHYAKGSTFVLSSEEEQNDVERFFNQFNIDYWADDGGFPIEYTVNKEQIDNL